MSNERSWQAMGDELLHIISELFRTGARAEERTTVQMQANGWSSRVTGRWRLSHRTVERCPARPEPNFYSCLTSSDGKRIEGALVFIEFWLGKAEGAVLS